MRVQSLSLESQKLQKGQKGGKGLLCPFPMRNCSALDSQHRWFFFLTKTVWRFWAKRLDEKNKNGSKVERQNRSTKVPAWEMAKKRLQSASGYPTPTKRPKRFAAGQISKLSSWDGTPTPSRSTESLAVAVILEPIRLEPKGLSQKGTEKKKRTSHLSLQFPLDWLTSFKNKRVKQKKNMSVSFSRMRSEGFSFNLGVWG